MATIADLKVKQICDWRREHLSDAHFLSRYSDLAFLTDRLLFNPQNQVARKRITDVLNSIYQNQNYVFIASWSVDGKLFLCLPSSIKPRYKAEYFRHAIRTREVYFSDIFLSASGQPAMHIYIPIIYEKDNQKSLVGIVQLGIDPNRHFYPAIQSWTTRRHTAEVMLIRQERDSVLILNELQYLQHTALRLQFPTSDTTSLLNRILRRQSGEIEGLDYRQIPVLAAFRPVPNTAWTVIVKLDKQEIDAPLRQRFRLEQIIFILLITLAGLALTFHWYQILKNYEIRYYRQQLEKEALVKHFDYLAKFAHDIIILCNERLHIVECNDRARETYGIKTDTPFIPTILDFCPQSEQAKFKATLDNIPLEGGVTFEANQIRGDGTVFPAEISVRRISGQPVGYLQLIIRDISERKQAERALAESEARYRALIDESPSAILIVQFGRIVFANPAALDLLAVDPPESIIGSPLDRILDTERAQDIHQRIERRIAGEKGLFPIEDYYIGYDGRAIPVEITAAPFIFDGSPAMQLIAFDITKQMQDRVKIVQLNRRLTLLTQVIQQLATLHKHEEIITTVTQAARKIAESDGASFVLKENDHCRYIEEDTITPLWKGSVFPLSACYAGWAIEHKKTASVANLQTDRRVAIDIFSPTTFIKSILAIPVRPADPWGAIEIYWSDEWTPEGELLQTLQALSDAAWVAIENAAAYQELEKRVAERTQQLEMANKELEAFSYSVSHDLRAPLRAIDGFARLLLEDHLAQLDPTAQRLFQVIRTNIGKMSQLINDLLTFSRTGRKALVWQKVDMQQLFSDTFEELRQAEPARQFNFYLGKLPVIDGDVALLRQLVVNLLSNAIKFTRPRPVAEITVGHQLEGGYHTFWIKDNGVGFDMRYVDKIFGVFQRLHHEDEFEGTGLGLALVKQIISKHDGKVWVQSELDRGTTVFFSLPERKTTDHQDEFYNTQ